MSVERVHPDLLVLDKPLFANATPAVFALIAEGLALSYRVGSWAGMPGGFLWAAVRAVERGEASCPALAVVSSFDIERHNAGYRGFASEELTLETIESHEVCNPHMLLPTPPCRGDTCEVKPSVFTDEDTVTVGKVLAEDMAEFDFRTAASLPWQEAGHDVRKIHETLLKDDGFVATDALNARGRIPDDRKAVYDKACELAESRGMWFLRGFDVEMAAVELGVSEHPPAKQDTIRERYQGSVDSVISILDHGGCFPPFSFPGPKPWGPSAAELLGVPLPDPAILAPWPTKEDVPALIDQLKDDQATQRWWAALKLARLRGDAAPAARALADAMADEDAPVRAEAARALGNLGPAAGDVLDPLIAAVDDEDEDTRRAAFDALECLGPIAAAAAAKLRTTWEATDARPGKRAAALAALAKAAPESPTTRNAVLAGLDGPDEPIQRSAIWALRAYDPLPTEAIPKLIGIMGGEDRLLAAAAAGAVALYGPAAKEAAPALVKLLTNREGETEPSDAYPRWRAADALGEIGPAAIEGVPALIEALDDSAVAGSATVALGKIGPAAKDAVPLMINKLADPDSRGAYLADAVGSMGPAAEAALPELLDMLVTGKTYARASAASALGQIAQTPEVVTALTGAASGDKERHVRICAAIALASIGGTVVADPGKTVRPILDEALREGDDEDRASAAYGLVHLGHVDEGLGILISILTDRAEDHMSSAPTFAAQLLGRLGPLAKQAESPLVEATRHENPRLTQSAWAALNRIRNADDPE